jgi:uncharacterized protein
VSDARILKRQPLRAVPIREFILKIASTCNLGCDYCYVYVMADQSWRSRPKLISKFTTLSAVRRIGEHASQHRLSEVTLILHGGEPLLAGSDMIEYVARAMRTEAADRMAVNLRIQTNGILLTDAMLRTLRTHHIRIGVSIDGGFVHHNRHRRWPDGRGSFAATARGLRLLNMPNYRDLYAGVLCVVDPRNDPVEVYESLLEFSPPAVDFLLPHGNWSTPPLGREPGVTSTPYADWLISAFDRWYGVERQETAVRLFQEIINLLLGGHSRTEQIGLSPVAFVVIDTDGSFQQVDALKTADEGGADTGLNVFDHSLDTVLHHPAVRARQLGLHALADTCRTCRIVRTCGGGHYAHRYKRDYGFQYPSVYCLDLQRLIYHVAERIRSDLMGDIH